MKLPRNGEKWENNGVHIACGQFLTWHMIPDRHEVEWAITSNLFILPSSRHSKQDVFQLGRRSPWELNTTYGICWIILLSTKQRDIYQEHHSPGKPRSFESIDDDYMCKEAVLTSPQFNEFQCFKDMYFGYDVCCYSILAFFPSRSMLAHSAYKNLQTSIVMVSWGGAGWNSRKFSGQLFHMVSASEKQEVDQSLCATKSQDIKALILLVLPNIQFNTCKPRKAGKE